MRGATAICVDHRQAAARRHPLGSSRRACTGRRIGGSPTARAADLLHAFPRSPRPDVPRETACFGLEVSAEGGRPSEAESTVHPVSHGVGRRSLTPICELGQRTRRARLAYRRPVRARSPACEGNDGTTRAVFTEGVPRTSGDSLLRVRSPGRAASEGEALLVRVTSTIGVPVSRGTPHAPSRIRLPGPRGRGAGSSWLPRATTAALPRSRLWSGAVSRGTPGGSHIVLPGGRWRRGRRADGPALGFT
jgi:hypothetical protein